MSKIFIIEDDKTLCDKLKETLVKWGFQVETTIDFSKCLEEFMVVSPDLVIMDVGLPIFDGFYWCAKIREISQVPILFLTSRDEENEQIMGMSLGADDYMTKPFNIKVLVAKINAIMRRTYDYKQDNIIEHLHYKGLSMDSRLAIVKFDEHIEDLTKNEIKMLMTLLENPEKVVSRNELMDVLWNDNQFVNDNTLTVNMNRLRQKLNNIGAVDFIVTKKGLGYMIKKE